MTTSLVQASYENLAAIAARLGELSDASAEISGRVRQCAEELVQNGWLGLGADSFANEMNTSLLPAMQRLVTALATARQVTLLASSTLQAAEEDAAGLFTGERSGIPPGEQLTSTSPGSSSGGDDARGSSGSPQQAEAPSGGLKGSLKLRELDLADGGQPGTSKLGFRYGVYEGEIWSKTYAGSAQAGSTTHNEAVKVSVGAYEAGIEAGVGKEGLTIGPYGEFTTVKLEREGVLGDEDLGLTRTDDVKGLAAEGFIGLKDGSIGASVGFTLVSTKSEIGLNVAGVNVGLSGEVGIKAEYGFRIGKKTEIKLPFFSFGISFGEAKDGKL